VITRALGMAPDVVVDLLTTDTRPGDAYLLCSDGLNGMLSDDEILGVCSSKPEMAKVCEELISRANAAGGNDNTTVVMVKVDPEDAKEDEEVSREPIAGGAIELIEQQGGLGALLGDDSDLPL
jgi:protein phosphatase